ncbi:hypothetical protein [Dyadobacter sp. OTU695]|uniref:hypothetical protein n=1 Tax=Dyadobacter sp. OTU695 TaxID=3043860 RepID=UPI00313AB463
MLEIKGTYQNGTIRLDSNPVTDLPVKVVVNFPDMDVLPPSPKILKWHDFSFSKSRQILKNLKSSLSEEVILERRNQ